MKKTYYFLIINFLILHSVQSQDNFNLKPTDQPRFTINDKVWPQEIGAANVCLWNDDKLSALTLTIDDNNEQDIPFWKKMQKKYDFNFTWFLITEADKKYNVKCWECYRGLARSGNAMQGHDDRNWYEYPKKGEKNTSEKKYKKRLIATQQKVEEQIPDQKCITYAFPWGEGNDKITSKLFIAVRDVVGLPNQANLVNYEHVNSISNPHIYGDSISRNKYFLPILTKTATIEGENYYRGWLSVHFHQVTSDEAHTKTDEFLQYIKNRENEIWVGTFPDVAKYSQEYATHKLTVNSASNSGIELSLSDEMQNDLYNFPLTVKVRIPNNWVTVDAMQNNTTLDSKIIFYNYNSYVLIKVVPDNGKVILKGTIDKKIPENNFKSRREMSTLTNGFYIPNTISKEAQKILAERRRSARNSASMPKAYAPITDWKEFQNTFNARILKGLGAIKKYYKPTIDTVVIGGIRAIDVKPKDYKKSDKVIVYVHGGAYVALSADVTLASILPLVEATGLRIIAIDYTLAPEAKFNEITDEVIQFYKGLLNKYSNENIAFYGDSAGGGLSAGSILKMRDLELPLPAVLVLWSPWTDISQTGDTYFTLTDNDPSLIYKGFLENAALAYAPKNEFKNPYVSPVYGDYTQNFPPTLIQVGSKEIFLSDAIRLYRALDDSHKEVKLDVYEGMWHVWQGYYQLPESKKAVENTKKFMLEYLNIHSK